MKKPAVPLIPLVQAKITPEDERYFRAKLDQGVLSLESEVGVLEDAFTELLGGVGSVATCSGSAAIHLALLAVGVQPGDEVIVPSYTCVSLLHSIRQCGAKEVLVDNAYDVSNTGFHPGMEQIEARMTQKTRALLIPHMFGTLAPLAPLQRLGVPIVEDFTQSLGAQIGKKSAGTLGTVGVCSLHWSKMISAGHGGIVVCHDPKVLKQIRSLGQYDSAMDEWRYLDESKMRGSYLPAYNYRMSAPQAALGGSQLKQLAAFIDRRLEIAAYYSREFEKAGIACPRAPRDRSNIFFRYMVESRSEVTQVLERLLQDGIQAGRGVYPSLHLLLDLPDSDFPGATQAVRKLISVPVHPSLTDSQVEFIAGRVSKALACDKI